MASPQQRRHMNVLDRDVYLCERCQVEGWGMGMEEMQLDNKRPAASIPVCNASSPEGTAYATTRSLARRHG